MLMMKHARPQSEVKKERLSKLQHNRKADAAGRPLWCPLINAQIHTWIETQTHLQIQHKYTHKNSTNTHTNTALIHTQIQHKYTHKYSINTHTNAKSVRATSPEQICTLLTQDALKQRFNKGKNALWGTGAKKVGKWKFTKSENSRI